jgi:hypothetical protein
MRDLAQLSNKDLSLVLSLLSASHHTTPVTRPSARVPSSNATHDGVYTDTARYCSLPAVSTLRLEDIPVKSNTYFATQQPFSPTSEADC